jgi:4-hydroxy-4-methyl-2-oxoglutarate aldolase
MSSEAVTNYAREFAALPTSAVSDALDRLGIKGQCSGVRALSPGMKLCGRTFTVQFLPCGPSDGRTPNGDIGDYIDDVPEGYVVALDNRGNLDSSVWDETMTRSARQRGIAGTVIDGACRGSMRSDARPYPLFALGAHSRSGKDRVRVEAYNLPIVIGGVRVECDDILLGDEDGLVVIPRDHLGAVLAAAREIAAAKK